MADAPPRPSVAKRVTPYRVIIVVILAGVAALWGYALTRRPQPPPDRLDDTAWSARAEEVCARNAAARDALPQAFQTDDPLERADVVERTNAELDALLATLRADVPTAERDRSMLDEWLRDWSVYVQNRRDYVERLRSEGDARIFVTEKDGRQITVAIDRFAEVNHMASCRTPKDVS